MSKPQITPQVPGESPATAAQVDAGAQEQASQQTEQAQATATPTAPATAETKPAKATGAAKKPQATADTDGGLPDQADIDPTKIRRSVLTKQGWVCPATAET